MRTDSEMLDVVRARAARIRGRRRAAVGTVAVVLAAAGIGGMVWAASGEPRVEQLHVVEPGTTTTTAATAATTTVVGSETPTSIAPTSTTRGPTTTTRPPTTTTQPPPNLVVQVSISPSPARTAEIATVTVHYADADGQGRTEALDYGDGTNEQIGTVSDSCVAGPAPHQGPSQGDERFSHSYRRTGTYTVRATVRSGGSCSATPVETVRSEATIRVTADASPSNGPQTPTGSLARNYPSSASAASMTVYGYGQDRDGYVSALAIDWGDGSSPATTSADMSQCHDPGTSWPTSDGVASGDQTHDFAQPGNYTVTLTVRSVGCDGRDTQIATVRMTYATGGPPSG